jgi:hypothetical protein
MLSAVGEQGQQRLAAATYAAPGGEPFAAEIEAKYLERAGARHFVAASDAPAPFAHAAVFQSAEARAFAEGAWRALRQIRNVLEQAT